MRAIGLGYMGFGMAVLLQAGSWSAPSPPAAGPTDPQSAVRRSLRFIQGGAARYVTHQECFSCHHQALPLLSCALAERKSLEFDRDADRQQLEFTVNYF